jgi:HSP90 family molecular chaperone
MAPTALPGREGSGRSSGDDDHSFKQDVAHLLLDEARILDGDRPENPGKFGDRWAHVLRRSLLPLAYQ